MFRALRLDKLIYQVLENTLRNMLMERWDDVPALAMLRQSADQVRRRAQALVARVPGLRAEVVAGQSVIGGGGPPQPSISPWGIAADFARVWLAGLRLAAGGSPCRAAD